MNFKCSVRSCALDLKIIHKLAPLISCTEVTFNAANDLKGSGFVPCWKNKI